MQRLGVSEALIRNKQELEAFVNGMSVERLAADKKKVKNELRCYDNDFSELFSKEPNHEEK